MGLLVIVISFLMASIPIIWSAPHERNSFLEYCSLVDFGNEEVCRDVLTMKEFRPNQLRVNGAFMIYNKDRTFKEISFGWGQCITLPKGSFIKLLPWAMWQRRPDIPLVIVISETIDLYTRYADQEAQIPLFGGKSHVIILNGELRSFRGNVHRRCVAPTPKIRGFTEYHFNDRNGSSNMKKYVITPKDKIYLGKEIMKECGEYARIDHQRDIFLKKTSKGLIPREFMKCKLACTNIDISIVRARNGTQLEERDENAGLPGVLVVYAMNETDIGYRQNRLYSPTLHGMLTAMYDTEVEQVTELTEIQDPGDRKRLGMKGNSGRRRSRRENLWPDEMMESYDSVLPTQKRHKRLSYSSGISKTNSIRNPYRVVKRNDELKCIA